MDLALPARQRNTSHDFEFHEPQPALGKQTLKSNPSSSTASRTTKQSADTAGSTKLSLTQQFIKQNQGDAVLSPGAL